MTSIAIGCPTWPPPGVRPPVRARAMGLPGGGVLSPTTIAIESATPGPALAPTTALPGATAVTRPALETRATVGAPLGQVASEEDSGFPAMSVTVAASCTAFPGASVVSVAYPGLTRTVAGAVSGDTVSRSVSAAPRIAAATRAAPPVGDSRAVMPRSGPTRIKSGVRLVSTTGTPATAVPAESMPRPITNQPPGAIVVSCGVTLTRHPAPRPHGPM